MTGSRPMAALLPLAAAAVLVAGCGSGDEPRARTVTTTATTTQERGTGGRDDEPVRATCTAATERAPAAVVDPDEAALPRAVRTTRDAIADAAERCDFAALGELADNDVFAYEEGAGARGGFGAYIERRDAEQRITARLVALMEATPHATIEADDLTIYAWPSAHAEAPSAGDWAALARSGAYSAAEVASFRRDAVYYGYRVGIRPDGRWTYFTAGG